MINAKQRKGDCEEDSPDSCEFFHDKSISQIKINIFPEYRDFENSLKSSLIIINKVKIRQLL